MNDNARKMAEDILNMLVGWEVVDKNDPDYQLFTQDIAAYLSKAASPSGAMIERLQSQLDAYQDYISGKITLGQLEAALNKIEPVYQQKPAVEWQEGRREE